jgi:mRNA-degrading endonuclease RelE of RelBE toxin-antitoxin system
MTSLLTDAALSPPVEVVFTPEFKRNPRQLAKKYRPIKADVEPLLDELTQGHTPGDQIPGVRYTVFKARVKNSDSRKGKSGGYRIIYQMPSLSLFMVWSVQWYVLRAYVARARPWLRAGASCAMFPPNPARLIFYSRQARPSAFPSKGLGVKG